MKAPEHCTIRNSPAERCVNRVIQLIGNTVTRWNSAKLASGISAPTRRTRAMVPDQRNDGRGFEPPPFEKTRKLIGGDEPQAREQGHDVDGEGAEEGIAPAPVQEIGLRQVEQEEGEQDARHHEAERRAELRDGGVEAAALDRRVKGEKRGEPIPRAAEGQALPDPQDAEEVQGPGADLRVARAGTRSPWWRSRAERARWSA